MLLGTTKVNAGTEYSSIVDRVGTGHSGYAYGTDISGIGTESSVIDFATYEYASVTGFLYANQRWYSAGYGKFLSVDPYGGSANPMNPTSWNRSAYTNGDPVNHIDSFGLDLEGPVPNTPPFGCDLFGGCVPGCNVIGYSDSLIWVNGVPSCYTPPPVVNEPWPSRLYTWSLDVGYTPTVNLGVGRNSYDHLFLWIHPTGDSNPADGDVYDGGPSQGCSILLQRGNTTAWVSKLGHYQELTNSTAVDFFSTQLGGSDNIFAGWVTSQLVLDVRAIAFSVVSHPYNPALGSNSNSVASSLLQSVGITAPILSASLPILGQVGVLNFPVKGQAQVFTGWGQNLLP